MPGSGTLQLTAGVGYLPAVLAQQQQALRTIPRVPEAHHSLALAVMPSIMGMYNRTINSEDELDGRLAFGDLMGVLHDERYGLGYTAWSSSSLLPDRCDVRRVAYYTLKMAIDNE